MRLATQLKKLNESDDFDRNKEMIEERDRETGRAKCGNKRNGRYALLAAEDMAARLDEARDAHVFLGLGRRVHCVRELLFGEYGSELRETDGALRIWGAMYTRAGRCGAGRRRAQG